MDTPNKPKRLGRVKKVAEELGGIGVASVWRLAKNDPTFPKPFKLGSNTTVFDLDALAAWVSAKQEAANDASAAPKRERFRRKA